MLTELAPQLCCDHVGVRLDDGQVVELRPLRPGETGPLLAVFDGMSLDSRALRYLTGMPNLPPRVLRHLSDVGDTWHMAWVATIDEAPVGIARYVAVDDCLVEVAFEVVDLHHGRGLGGVLLDAVATTARANGFVSVTATVHPSNVASVRLLNRLGLRLRASDGLLEGEGLLRLPDPARVDRVAVLDVLAQSASPGLNQPRVLAGCSTQ